MPKKRRVETPQERKERFESESERVSENAAAADRAVDEMVKRSIKEHGA